MSILIALVATGVIVVGLHRAEISTWVTNRVGYAGFWIFAAAVFGLLVLSAHLLDRAQPASSHDGGESDCPLAE
jgi:hypothetical protein